MSKHDTHFFNVFSVVLGILVAFAILVFALARFVGKNEQNPHALKTLKKCVSCLLTGGSSRMRTDVSRGL